MDWIKILNLTYVLLMLSHIEPQHAAGIKIGFKSSCKEMETGHSRANFFLKKLFTVKVNPKLSNVLPFFT